MVSECVSVAAPVYGDYKGRGFTMDGKPVVDRERGGS